MVRRAETPRSFQLSDEVDKGEKGQSSSACSYGLDTEKEEDPRYDEKDPRARPSANGEQPRLEFKYWRATIWGPPHGTHENRIYELALECGAEYNKKPPAIYFVSKINLPGVDQRTGKLDPKVIPFLNDWSEIYERYMESHLPTPPNIESALLAIRKYMDHHKKLEQPPEGSKYEIYK